MGRPETGDYRSALRPPRPARVRANRPSAPRDVGTAFESRDGRKLRLRRIHVDDVASLMRAFGRMTPEQVRLRVFHVLTELPEPAARRLCDIDMDKVAAFVVTDLDDAEIRGEARVHFDEVTQAAEFAIAIDPAFTGKGVGWALMNRLVDASRARGLLEIWGHVLAENSMMIDLALRLGFERETVNGEPGLLLVRKSL